MAEEFTFANVRRAVNGIARYVVSKKSTGARIILGRDPRFLGEAFCSMAAEIPFRSRHHAAGDRGYSTHSSNFLRRHARARRWSHQLHCFP